LGTEIRTFTSLKDLNDFLIDEIEQYKVLHEDYSQWLGSLLRSCEDDHKNEEWYQKAADLQKTLSTQMKKAPAAKEKGKKNGGKKGGGKGKNETPVWVQSGNLSLCSTEQGQAEILFEAIEKINVKMQEIEKAKTTIQQLERLGLGANISYIVYLEDDAPKKVVLRANSSPKDEVFRFATELSVPALFRDFDKE
jgi:transposase